MPVTPNVQTVNQAQNAIDLNAVRLAAAKAVNASATTSHGVSVESIATSHTQAAGHVTTIHLLVRT